MRMVLSRLPDRIVVLSSEMATHRTDLECPVRVCSCLPAQDQTLTLQSALPDTKNCPSERKCTEFHYEGDTWPGMGRFKTRKKQ